MTEENSIEPRPQAGGPGSTDAASALAGDDPRVVAFFGDAHETIAQFAALLADQGVIRGLIGPREVARLWERHLINSASVVSFLPASGTVIDVGSGAGLPGIVLAAIRPDLRVVLLEPMERRVAWLTEVVEQLGLGSVEILRGRAEDMQGTLVADAVTARAVAPLDRLAGWTLPLLRAGGVLLAMKGQTARQELEDAAPAIRSLGGGPGEVLEAPTIDGLAGTTIIRVVRELVIPRAPAKPKAAKGKVTRGAVARGAVARGAATKRTAGKGMASSGSGVSGARAAGVGAKGSRSGSAAPSEEGGNGTGSTGAGRRGAGPGDGPRDGAATGDGAPSRPAGRGSDDQG